MSLWYEIKDKEDCNISEDGKMLQVNFDGDYNGNIWIEVPVKFIKDLLSADELTFPTKEEILKQESLYNDANVDTFENGAEWALNYIRDKQREKNISNL